VTQQARTVAVLASIVAIATPAWSPAQSLAEIARKEQERRKAIKVPSKVYTNADLRRSPPISIMGASETQPSPASTSSAPAPATKAASSGLPSAGEPVRDEQWWRSRMMAARLSLERSQVLLGALEARVNALTTDFVNRDDPAQRALIGDDRQRAMVEMERMRAEIQRLQAEIADIEEEARRAGVPPGWLR
jgi:hypothetical protein